MNLDYKSYLHNVDIDNQNKVFIDYSKTKDKEFFDITTYIFTGIIKILDNILLINDDPLIKYKLYTENTLDYFINNYDYICVLNYIQTRHMSVFTNEEKIELIELENLISSKQCKLIIDCLNRNYFKKLEPKMVSKLMRIVFMECTINKNPLYVIEILDFLNQNIFISKEVYNKYNSLDVSEYLEYTT